MIVLLGLLLWVVAFNGPSALLVIGAIALAIEIGTRRRKRRRRLPLWMRG